MKSFREWLLALEASTDYLRSPGQRQDIRNPFWKAGWDTEPYHYQALMNTGMGLSNVMQKAQFPASQGTAPPSPEAGFGGQYEGLVEQGLEKTFFIGIEEAGQDPSQAKYLALQRMHNNLQQTNRLNQFDIRQAMVAKNVFIRNTPDGQGYQIDVMVPFRGVKVEKIRDTETAAEIMHQHRLARHPCGRAIILI